jgi:hypothetical protein
MVWVERHHQQNEEHSSPDALTIIERFNGYGEAVSVGYDRHLIPVDAGLPYSTVRHPGEPWIKPISPKTVQPARTQPF